MCGGRLRRGKYVGGELGEKIFGRDGSVLGGH